MLLGPFSEAPINRDASTGCELILSLLILSDMLITGGFAHIFKLGLQTPELYCIADFPKYPGKFRFQQFLSKTSIRYSSDNYILFQRLGESLSQYLNFLPTQ